LSNIETIIYKLKSREITLADFEKWIYSEKSLEEILPSDDYLELISLSYKKPSDLYEAEKILFKLVGKGKYYEWYLRNVLNKVIDRTAESASSIQLCYELYCDGYNFLDNLGLGYGLSIAVPPSEYKAEEWNQLSNSDQKKLIDSFYPAVAEEAKRVIHWLDTGKVMLTGYDETFQGIQYDDNRSEDDKKPTAYEVAKPKKKWWKFWS